MRGRLLSYAGYEGILIRFLDTQDRTGGLLAVKQEIHEKGITGKTRGIREDPVIGNDTAHMKKPHLRWEGGAYRWEMLSVHNRSVRVATNGTTISARIGEVESSMGSTAAVGVVGRSVGLLRSGIPAAGVAVATTIRGIAAIVGLGLSLSRRLCLGFSLRLGCCLGVGILLRSLEVVHLFDGGSSLPFSSV